MFLIDEADATASASDISHDDVRHTMAMTYLVYYIIQAVFPAKLSTGE